MKPAVSILVPICNVQRYLRECIESLVNQTLREIEIILINDGSTDDSLSIVREFERRDPRIVVIDKPNSGYGDSMNQGLDRATGEYVGIVESDDFAAPSMFEKLYGAAKEHDADVVKSNFYAYSTTGEEGEHEELVENLAGCPYDTVFRPVEHQTVFLCRPAIWSGLYRRSFLVENDVRFLPTPGASFQDTGFCFKLLYAAERAYLLRKGFLRYRVDNDGSSVKSQAKIFPICEEYAEIWRYAQRDAEKFEKIKRRIPYQQFGGYRWNLERLVPQIRRQFYVRMIDEFQRISAAGLLDASYFDGGAWETLSSMLADPEEHYLRAYGPVEVAGTVVACLSGLAREDVLASLPAVLDATSDSDEVLLVHEDAGALVAELRASDARAGRVYDDADLLTSKLLLGVDAARIRGGRLALLCASRAVSAADLGPTGELLSRDGARVPSEGVLVLAGETDALLSHGSFLPVMALRALLATLEVSSLPAGLGMCGDSVSVVTPSTFEEAVGELVRFADDLMGSELSYEAKRAVFAAALPIWSRVRKSFSRLDDLDAEPIRPVFEGMADSAALVFPAGGESGPKSPAVSVIVPVYNALAYLFEAVESILRQDLRDIEVIFVNDGSTDASLDALESIASKDARVRVVSQFNCGAGAARNRGISLARGGALAFIDPDDLYASEHALSALLEGLHGSGSLMCGGSFSLLTPSGKVKEEFSFAESFYTADVEKDVALEHVWNDYGWIRFLYDARLFADGSVRFPQLSWYEDPVFLTRAVCAAGGYHLIPDVVYRYRVGYKKTEWTPARIRDLLWGIRENLRFAAGHDMAELYTTVAGRLERDYYWPIMKSLADEEVFRSLLAIQNELRSDLILPSRETGERIHLLKPLADLASDKNRKRETAIVRLAHKLEQTPIYEGIQRAIWRSKGQNPE